MVAHHDQLFSRPGKVPNRDKFRNIRDIARCPCSTAIRRESNHVFGWHKGRVRRNSRRLVSYKLRAQKMGQ